MRLNLMLTSSIHGYFRRQRNPAVLQSANGDLGEQAELQRQAEIEAERQKSHKLVSQTLSKEMAESTLLASDPTGIHNTHATPCCPQRTPKRSCQTSTTQTASTLLPNSKLGSSESFKG